MTKSERKKIESLINSDDDANQAIGLIQWYNAGMNVLCFSWKYRRYKWTDVSYLAKTDILSRSVSIAGYVMCLRCDPYKRFYDPKYYMTIEKGEELIEKSEMFKTENQAREIIPEYATKIFKAILSEFDIII